MQSPFPGMNPYLEQEDAWHDFHEQFCIECRAQLVPQIQPGYIANLDEHVYIHELPAEERRLLGRGDVTLAETETTGTEFGGQGTIAAPAYAVVPAVDFERESFIEIRDRKSRQLVTVIELLSPSNKQPGADRHRYLTKRWTLMQSGVNLVEIDLLRGGPRLPLDDLPACDYYALVSRPEEAPKVGVWPIQLRDTLPTIPVPLQTPDPDARLDLQAALHAAFAHGGYGNYIYGGTPRPELSPADARWADVLLQSAGSLHTS